MPSLELCPLSTHLEESEINLIVRELAETDVDDVHFDEDADPVSVPQNYDDDVFVDFWDQIEANDVACDVYLPLEFEDVLEVGGRRIGSSHALLIVLANIREDMFLDDDDDDDDENSDAVEVDDELEEFDEYGAKDDDTFAADEENPIAVKDQQIRHVWRSVHRGATVSLAQGLALFVHE